MSLLFTPIQIGSMKLRNRFIHSATFENMGGKNGEITDTIIKRYRTLARGEIGLIIPGLMYVHHYGKSYENQIGIHSDDMVPGLKKLVDAVHNEGGKIVFQLVHAGRQSVRGVIGRIPMAPSWGRPDIAYYAIPKKMREEDILESIQAFGNAAKRAAEAGADGVQLHAANGFLINQFLSPFFNKRKDQWGGSDENRFRYFKEVYNLIRKILPESMPILVKLNTNEHTPKQGITPELAEKYAAWMAELGIDGLELGSGTISFSNFHIWRGDVPVAELVRSLPLWMKLFGWLIIKSMEGKYDFVEGYTLGTAAKIKPVMGNIPLFSVGGLRRVEHMEQILNSGIVDCISLCRPFIREPMLVKKIRENKANTSSCISCNKCVGAIQNKLPIACYYKGLPEKLK